MNKEVKKLWIAALRSGKYDQGKHSLKKKDDFCCLGVLCDISEVNCWSKITKDGLFAYDNDTAVLPKSVIDWAGLEDRVPSVEYCGKQYNLVELNDEAGLTFEEIADIIEREL